MSLYIYICIYIYIHTVVYRVGCLVKLLVCDITVME